MLTVADNFNRADGGLGANWTTIFTQQDPMIAGNLVQTATATANDSVAAWNAGTFTPNQFAQITVLTANTGTDRGVGVILRGNISGVQTYYRLRVRGPLGIGTATLYIGSVVASAFADIATVSAKTVVSGDILRGEVVDTNIRLLINGAVQLVGTSTAISAAGAPGVYVYSDVGAVTDAQLDNWSGGDLGSYFNNRGLRPAIFRPGLAR